MTTVKRVSLERTRRIAPHDATEAGRTSPQQVMSVSVIVRRRGALSLKDLGGKHISRKEFNEKYASDPADFGPLFEPAQDKVYRHPTFYKIPDVIKHI